MTNICIVPARMASSRFPGKPLKPLLGLELILHVYERCRLSAALDRVVIATCDEDIRARAEAHGAEAVMTAASHPGCVDRTDEAIDLVGGALDDDDLVLMVQGDEILVGPEMIDEMVATYQREKPPVVNLASRLYSEADHDDPNCVKVVTAPDGRAIYFSRAPIPSRYRVPDWTGMTAYQQTGVIGFSKAFVRGFGELARTPLEMIEQVDMMRVIEHGLPIQIVRTETETIGVDTPADLARAEAVLRQDPTTRRYMDIPA